MLALGERTIRSPLGLSTVPNDDVADYVRDDSRVALFVETFEGEAFAPPTLERAGPREHVYFDPAQTRAAIVTCGGLCPGINNVIRGMVLELHHKYGVKHVLGFRFGYDGLVDRADPPPVHLGPSQVRSIHAQGGSVLGMSRGAHDPAQMVDTLQTLGVNVLFSIGGDGTLRGAHAIHAEIARRGLPIGIVAVPKTIDNDVPMVDKTFGFESAVDVARQAIDAAHTEARGVRNGIAIVKLMGRDAGFIAAHATLASADVNFCLIPEARFDLEGEHGLLAALERRVRARGHAVVVVAEGCAEHFAAASRERNASGNVLYGTGALDVGPMLRLAIEGHMRAAGLVCTLKYIDPSYMLRSVPANAIDSIFCDQLARHAVHAGMAGKTDVLIGRCHRVFTHVPLALVTVRHKRVDTDGELWLAVTETTGQPRLRND